MQRDPIKLLESYIREHNVMTDEKMEAIEEELISEVDKIYEEADASPFPDPDEVYSNVYTNLEPEVGH